jgi:hypothetical protein
LSGSKKPDLLPGFNKSMTTDREESSTFILTRATGPSLSVKLQKGHGQRTVPPFSCFKISVLSN